MSLSKIQSFSAVNAILKPILKPSSTSSLLQSFRWNQGREYLALTLVLFMAMMSGKDWNLQVALVLG